MGESQPFDPTFKRPSRLRPPAMPSSWTKKRDLSDAPSTRLRRLTSLSHLLHPRRTSMTPSDANGANEHQTAALNTRRLGLLRSSTTAHLIPRGSGLSKIPRTSIDVAQWQDSAQLDANDSRTVSVPGTRQDPKHRWSINVPVARDSKDEAVSERTYFPPTSAFPRNITRRDVSHEEVRQSIEKIFPRSEDSTTSAPDLVTLSSQSTRMISGLLACVAPDSTPPNSSIVLVEDQAAVDVYVGQPTAYWCGRFSSKNDGLRDLSLAPDPTLLEDTPGNLIRLKKSDLARAKEACLRLQACCKTEEAMRSLAVFVAQMAVRLNLPELADVVTAK